MEQVFPTLRLLCIDEVNSEDNLRLQIQVSATSLVNDVFIKLNNGASETRVKSVRTFYTYLSRIVQEVLLDRYRVISAKKRSLEEEKNYDERNDYIDSLSRSEVKPDFSELIKSLNDLNKEKPTIAQALSFKYFAARNVEQISKIMDKSPSTIESYLKKGKYLLKENMTPKTFVVN